MYANFRKIQNSRRNLLRVAIILAIFFITTACSMLSFSTSGFASQEEMQIAAATSVAATLQAVERGSAEQVGEVQPVVQQPQPVATQPAPTLPAGKSASSLSINTLTVNPAATVYYGFCRAGETMSATIQAGVTPADQVASVRLYYWFTDSSGRNYNGQTVMSPVGGGKYSAVVDVGVEGPLTLMGDSGWLNFYAEVTDKNGALINSSIHNIAVWYCPELVAYTPVPPQGVADKPVGIAQPPESIALPPANIVNYPLPIFNYFVGPSKAVLPGDEVTIEWEVLNAPCGVYFDTNPVNSIGYRRYTVPLSGAPATITHQLVAYGEPCSNPTILTRELTVNVDLQSAVAPSAPSNLQWSTNAIHTYKFTWSDNSSSETGFYIYSTYSNGQAGKNATSYTLNSDLCGLEPVTFYVTAYNSFGESAPSNSVTLEGYVLCEPSAPTLWWNDYYKNWVIGYPGPWGSTFIPVVFSIYRNGSYYSQTSEFYLDPPPCGSSWDTYITVAGPGGVSGPSNIAHMVGICP